MALHDLELALIEASWLQQDGVGNADLANVVHGTGHMDKICLFLGNSHLAAQSSSEGTDAQHVVARLVVALVSSQRELGYRLKTCPFGAL